MVHFVFTMTFFAPHYCKNLFFINCDPSFQKIGHFCCIWSDNCRCKCGLYFFPLNRYAPKHRRDSRIHVFSNVPQRFAMSRVI